MWLYKPNMLDWLQFTSITYDIRNLGLYQPWHIEMNMFYIIYFIKYVYKYSSQKHWWNDCRHFLYYSKTKSVITDPVVNYFVIVRISQINLQDWCFNHDMFIKNNHGMFDYEQSILDKVKQTKSQIFGNKKIHMYFF